MAWDPSDYLTYADERGRPYGELLARVAVEPDRVRRVVDLGCGPGNLTALLGRRWPDAAVVGVDSSPEMLERARRDHADLPGLSFALGDVRTWTATAPVDVVVSNATYQWVPGHLDLLPGLLAQVAPGGSLAFSVPGNVDEPSHVLRRDLAATAPYAMFTAGVADPAAHDAATYLGVLAAAGAEVDAWETTYLHVLRGGADVDQLDRRAAHPGGAARRPARPVPGGAGGAAAGGVPHHGGRRRARRRAAVPPRLRRRTACGRRGYRAVRFASCPP